MVYGYIRVSTDKQTLENQRYEINEFCKANGLSVDEWIEETISGTIIPTNRKLGKLLDIGAKVWTIKDSYRLGDDIQSKVLAFAFGLSAEIERQLISQRTKEALAMSVMILAGTSVNQMAKLYGLHRNTIKRFIVRHDLP